MYHERQVDGDKHLGAGGAGQGAGAVAGSYRGLISTRGGIDMNSRVSRAGGAIPKIPAVADSPAEIQAGGKAGRAAQLGRAIVESTQVFGRHRFVITDIKTAALRAGIAIEIEAHAGIRAAVHGSRTGSKVIIVQERIEKCRIPAERVVVGNPAALGVQ